MTEEIKRLRRVCFTGHRPEKLNRSEKSVLDGLETAIRQAIADGSNVFISGMARGVDIWAAEIVLQIRSEGEDIKLICASPYRGFEKNWSIDWQRRYNNVIEAADLVRFICPNYSKSCFQIRNEWMVDHSSRVIAVFNGQLGGTKKHYRLCQNQSCRNMLCLRNSVVRESSNLISQISQNSGNNVKYIKTACKRLNNLLYYTS